MASYGDDDDGSGPLNITPSFKQRGSKKGKARAAIVDDGNEKAASRVDDAGDTSAPTVIFRSKGKDRNVSALGGSSSGKASLSRQSSSRLALSFDDEANDSETSVHNKEGDLENPPSSVRRPEDRIRKLKRPIAVSSNSIGGSGKDNGANQAVARALSNSMSQANITRSSAGVSSNVGPSYSTDYLASLKASTMSAPPRQGIEQDTGDLSGSNGGLIIGSYDNDDQVGLDQDDMSAFLPSSATIAAAKAKRETARRLGIQNGDASMSTSEDFISLGGRASSTALAYPVKSGTSRLPRESDDEEVASGDDEHAAYTEGGERVPLGKKARKAAARGRRDEMRELIEGTADDNVPGILEEEDEDEQRWQEELIRRGAARPTYKEEDAGQAIYRPAQIPDLAPMPTLKNVQARLTASLQAIQTSKVESDTLLSSLEREQTALQVQTTELRAEIDRVSTKYEWYTAFRSWADDMASFLDAKYPLLEKVEADNLSIQKERMSLIEIRRYKDDSDDVASFTGAQIPCEWTVTGKAANSDTDVMDVDGQQTQRDMDEFGRSRSEASELSPRSLVRRTRREERVRRRQRRSIGTVEDGMETEDDLHTSDSTDLRTASEALIADSQAIFSDVKAEEFKDPEMGVRPRFDEWLKQYPEDYANAFGGLGMVEVWEFWARCEMASWNPFNIQELPPPTKLDDCRWQHSLADYQHTIEEAAGPQPADDNVVVALITTVVIPKLRRLTLEAFDPLSSKATTSALNMVEQLTYVIETSHARFIHLITAFLGRFQYYAARYTEIVQPFLSDIRNPPTLLDTDAIEARNRFARRILKLVVSALRWRKYGKGILLPAGSGPGSGSNWDSFISDILVGSLCLPVIRAGWETGGRQIAQQITQSCPPGVLTEKVLKSLAA